MKGHSIIVSTHEAERILHSEMGFYYFFFKTIVESETLSAGLHALIYDNKTEYPNTVNALHRFNLFPEVVLGGSFRVLVIVGSTVRDVLRTSTTSSNISVGSDQDFAYYWYLSGVWLCIALTVLLLFVCGAQLSKSAAGGLVTVACFILCQGESLLSFGEVTELVWAPPMRTGFAFPFSLCLNAIVTFSVRRLHVSWRLTLLFGNIVLIYLMCWHFARYILFGIVLIFYILYLVGPSEPLPIEMLLLGSIYALVTALVIKFSSPITPFIALFFLVVLLHFILYKPVGMKTFTINLHALFFGMLFLAFFSNDSSVIFPIEDEPIWNLIEGKFSGYSDFHTRFYSCSTEIDSFSKETFAFLKTFAVPGGVLFYAVTRALLLYDIGVGYNVHLLVFYGFMAGPMMRLKVLFIPQLCVVASLFVPRSLCQVIKKRKIYLVFSLVICVKCVQGVFTLKESAVGEYNGENKFQLEELLQWVNNETGEDSVFAGPMSTMASILLHTRRPIVNHPHHGTLAHSLRTQSVYSLFSGRLPKEVHDTMASMQVEYVVLEASLCLGGERKPGCSLPALWNVEEPHNAQRPLLCPQLFRGDASPFRRCFSNEAYVVLRV